VFQDGSVKTWKCQHFDKVFSDFQKNQAQEIKERGKKKREKKEKRRGKKNKKKRTNKKKTPKLLIRASLFRLFPSFHFFFLPFSSFGRFFFFFSFSPLRYSTSSGFRGIYRVSSLFLLSLPSFSHLF
jgi:hypothetical protein